MFDNLFTKLLIFIAIIKFRLFYYQISVFVWGYLFKNAGELALPYDTAQGLERVLDAYRRMLTGGNVGKVIVELKA